jgi:hypothetical protein
MNLIICCTTQIKYQKNSKGKSLFPPKNAAIKINELGEVKQADR